MLRNPKIARLQPADAVTEANNPANQETMPTTLFSDSLETISAREDPHRGDMAQRTDQSGSHKDPSDTVGRLRGGLQLIKKRAITTTTSR